MSNRKKMRTPTGVRRKRRARCPICRCADLNGKVFDDILYIVCMECGHHWPAPDGS